MCHLEPKQFVGSMAFNRFIQTPAPPLQRNESTTPDADDPSTASHSNASTTADTSATRATPSRTPTSNGTNPNSITSWHDTNPDGTTPKVKSVTSNGITTTTVGIADRNRELGELEYIDDSYIEDSYVPGGGGVFEEAKEVALDLLRRESIVGEVAKSFVAETEAGRESGAEMERSATTVTTTSDVSYGRRGPSPNKAVSPNISRFFFRDSFHFQQKYIFKYYSKCFVSVSRMGCLRGKKGKYRWKDVLCVAFFFEGGRGL